jgi:hypothetical protein
MFVLKINSYWMREKQQKMKINSEGNENQAFAISTYINEGVGYSCNDLANLDYFALLVDCV